MATCSIQGHVVSAKTAPKKFGAPIRAWLTAIDGRSFEELEEEIARAYPRELRTPFE